MRKILLILFLFGFFGSYAQDTKDSSDYINIRGKNVKMREVSDYYNGTGNDSITGATIGGKKYERDDLRSGFFTLQELGVKADGTDQTNLLNYQLATHIYIKGINLDRFGGGVITISGSVNFQNKILQSSGGTYFTGGGSLSNVKIDAGDVQLMDSSITFSSNVISASGTVSMKWWGAKGDGSNDDTEELRSGVSIQNQSLVLPPGTYKLTAGIKIDSTNSFDGSKGVFVGNGITGPVVTIGSDSLNNSAINATQGKTYYIRIRRSSQSNWSDSSAITDIGLRAKNLYRSKLTIDINGFTCNALLTGDLTNGGFTESDIYGSSTNGFKNVWYTRTGNGYFNSNTFHNMSIRIDSDVNPGKRAYGFVAGTEGDEYLHNNNTVDAGSIQLNGSNRVALDLIYAYQSKYINWRDESNGITAVIHNNSDQNLIKPGFSFVGNNIIDNSTGGNNLYEAPRDQNLSGANSYTVFEWSAAGNGSAYSSTNTGLRGIGMYSSTGEPITFAPVSYLDIFPEFIRVKQTGLSVGVEFSTANSKTFLIKHSHKDTAYGRALVTMYDENKSQLVTTAPKMEGLYPTYNGAWGGGWLTAVNTPEDYFLKLPDSCKTVKIAFVGPTGNALDLKSVSIHTVGPNKSNISPLFGGAPLREENISTAAPTWTGTYEEGKKIYYATPATTGTVYWLTKVAGTNRNLTSASGSISSGSNELTVTGASIDSIYVGEYLSIDGNKYKIGRKSSTKIYLTQAASGTYSGTINYFPAEFIEVKNGGGTTITGGGGGFTGDLD